MIDMNMQNTFNSYKSAKKLNKISNHPYNYNLN